MPDDTILKQIVRDKYPFPISHAYTYLESRIDPNDRYQAVLACFEVTLKAIASIALWSAINIYQQFILARTGQTLDDLRKQLRQGLTHR